jgi:hypothetical protein
MSGVRFPAWVRYQVDIKKKVSKMDVDIELPGAAVVGEKVITCSCGVCKNRVDFLDYGNGVVDLEIVRVRDGEDVGVINIVLTTKELMELEDFISEALDRGTSKKME